MLKKNGAIKDYQVLVQPPLKAPVIFNVVLMIVLPVCAILVETIFWKTSADPALIAKWFIFWGLGVRLFIYGAIQLFKPAFAAFRIFRLRNKGSIPVIKELGAMNISVSAIAILSFFNEDIFRAASIPGCIFFGLAILRHLTGKEENNKEIISLITDLIMFVVSLLYVFFFLFN